MNKKPNSGTTRQLYIPTEILSIIFSFLPTKSLLSFTLVCKSWCSIIRNPNFTRSSQSIALLIRRDGDNRGNKNLHLIEPEIDCTIRQRNGDLCLVLGKKSVIKFNDDGFDGHPVKMLDVVNSCKGLVCLQCGYELRRRMYPPPFFLYNPVTSDYVIIKQQRPVSGHLVENHAGFGFSSEGGQYKLVRFSSELNGCAGGSLDAEVYTIGSDQNWRIIERRPPQFYIWWGKATFLEGSLHWITVIRNVDAGSIVAFDCNEEKFVLMPVPNCMIFGPRKLNRPIVDLGILQARLCICNWNLVQPYDCDIWVMDVYGVKESWRKLFVVSLGESPNNLMPFKPLAYLKNGEVLMLSVNGELVSFDVRSNKWKAVKVHGVTPKVEATLFDPTFVPANILLTQERIDNNKDKR